MKPLALPTIPPARFDCDRTCPAYGEILCRFSPILRTFTRITVDSHTARIPVDYDDEKTLRAAVEAIGGIWIGYGKHQLSEGSTFGSGFRLPFAGEGKYSHFTAPDGKTYWRLPIVLREDGELAYDDYQGHWGDVAGLARLKAEYVWTKAKAAADLQGWLHSQTEDVLTVYCPTGGRVEITATGAVEAHDFHGIGCHEAIQQIAPNAVDLTAKPQAYELQARAHETI